MPLTMHPDERGVFTELFRQNWFNEIAPVQWNVVHSHANVLRGVHVHLRHADYLTVVSGRAIFGLCDLRAGSPTEGLRVHLEMDGRQMQSLVIPPGVAHGFCFLEPSVHVYSVSEYWNPEDELGCHFADPELALTWPIPRPLVSARDAELPPLGQLIARIPAWLDDARVTRPEALSAAGSSHAR
jgi:dTDP-4-dehydrorhamnose 3,5-epimerase